MMKVYPRDLFNDSNLLKCAGQLALHNHNNQLPKGWSLEIPEPYQIEQDDSSGGTYIIGMRLTDGNRLISFERPLNSREAWPLVASEHYNYIDVEVFDEQGEFDQEFLKLLEEQDK